MASYEIVEEKRVRMIGNGKDVYCCVCGGMLLYGLEIKEEDGKESLICWDCFRKSPDLIYKD